MDESFIDRLLSAISIEDVIGEYVILRPNGDRFVGLCPFHSEKTASFTVFTATQSFYCFGCGKGGSVINFIQQKENLDRFDAIKLLADRAGLEIPQSGDTESYRRTRDSVIEMNTALARHFYDNLMGEKGAAAREYFRNRRLKASTVKHFGLGYAPDEWDDGVNYLRSLGYRPDDMVSAGLAVKGKNGGVYDRFRNRVMYPIIDIRGRIIAFGGRVMDDSKPKYLNSPDTAAFKKSSVLFALNFAKNNNNGRLILCEGYMDVISLHQAGFTQAVATNGTAITQEHARLISRYAKEVVIAYDSDGAGQNATNKAIKLLNETGINVRVLSLDSGKDPDEYIKTHGAEKFARLLDESGSQISFLLHKARAKYDITLPEDKTEYLKEAVKILADIQSPVEAEVYITRLARETEISDIVIKNEIEATKRKRRKIEEKTQLKTENEKLLRDRLNPMKASNLKAARAEETLIAILLKHPDYYEKLTPKITANDFITPFNKGIFSVLEDYIKENRSISLSTLSQRLTNEETSKLTEYTVNVVLANNGLKQASDCAEALRASGKTDITEKSAAEIQSYISSMNKKKREE